jgi:hypothetical protein
VASDFDRQRRVVDQMITAHGALRDRLTRLGLAQDVLVLVSSTVLAASAMIDPVLWPRFWLTPEGGRILLGVVSTLVFASTVVDLRVRWKERAGAHSLAANALSELKAVGRLIDPNAAPDDARKWIAEVSQVMKTTPTISESQFLRLKSRHLRKVAVSELIDKHPGASPTLLRMGLVLAHSIESLRHTRDE